LTEFLLSKFAAGASCIEKNGSSHAMYRKNLATIYTSTDNSHTK
jgi:hypothetical protein